MVQKRNKWYKNKYLHFDFKKCYINELSIKVGVMINNSNNIQLLSSTILKEERDLPLQVI